MKMKKLLSIGALTLTLVTCTSISTFAAEASKNRDSAIEAIATNLLAGENVINDLNINSKTAVKKYAKEDLIIKINYYITESMKDKELAAKVTKTIEDNYKDGQNAEEIFESISSINNEDTFNAFKEAIKSIINEFEIANEESKLKLDEKINSYFNVSRYGKLEYGRNSKNRRVVTLKNNSKIILQISSENLYNLKSELKERFNSWEDINGYIKGEK